MAGKQYKDDVYAQKQGLAASDENMRAVWMKTKQEDETRFHLSTAGASSVAMKVNPQGFERKERRKKGMSEMGMAGGPLVVPERVAGMKAKEIGSWRTPKETQLEKGTMAHVEPFATSWHESHASSSLPRYHKGAVGGVGEVVGKWNFPDDSVFSSAKSKREDTAGGRYRVVAGRGSGFGDTSSRLVYKREDEQQSVLSLAAKQNTLQTSSESAEAIEPLTSLIHEFALTDYQKAVYEQRYGLQSSSSSKGLQADLYSAKAEEKSTVGPVAGADSLSRKRETLRVLQQKGLPDLVEGDLNLKMLTPRQLIDQCHVRDCQKLQSELHEEEMGTRIDEVENECQEERRRRIEAEMKVCKLEDEYKMLREENKMLRARLPADNLESLPEQPGGLTTADRLQMVVLLYTCQAKDFEKLKVIAHGCEGVVLLVKCNKESNLLHGRKFALKVMFNVFSHATLTQVRNYYQNEYTALCTMSPHPNIVRLYAFFYDRLPDLSTFALPPIVVENARTLSLFLIMEFILDTLQDVTESYRSSGKLTGKQVMKWTLQILKGIQHMLKFRFVHRDLKLNNVLVDSNGTAKLCDFGCSVQLTEDMTMLYGPGGSLGGNAAHMAPELLNTTAGHGRHIKGDRQDMWACALMVYEMACGRSPFEASGGKALDQRGYRMCDLPPLVIKNEKTSGLMSSDEELSQPFVELVMSMLEYDPSKRPSIEHAIMAIQQELDR